jgi:hypothetical protein
MISYRRLHSLIRRRATSGAGLAFLPQPKTGFFRERRTVDCRWDGKKTELALQLPGTKDDQSINPTKEAA